VIGIVETRHVLLLSEKYVSTVAQTRSLVLMRIYCRAWQMAKWDLQRPAPMLRSHSAKLWDLSVTSVSCVASQSF